MAKRISGFPHFSSACVHTKYTYNIAACYGNDVNDTTAPHVFTWYGNITE